MEKSPPTIVRSRFFQALFPDARFVFLLRHPIAVSLSTARWTGQSLHELIAHWIVAHERFQADLPYIRRARVLRYEDFVGDPIGALRDVWALLDLEPEPLQREIRGGLDSKYFRKWRRVGWTPRGRRYLARISERWEPRLKALGYGYSLDRPHI